MASRKTTNRLRAIETVGVRNVEDDGLAGRKTTNRLRAIETLLRNMVCLHLANVARQLIAFGRLKRSAS